MSISITNTIKLFVIEGDDWYCTQSELLHTVSQFGCQILLSCNCHVRCEEVLKLLPFNKIKGSYSGINRHTKILIGKVVTTFPIRI